MYCAMEGVEWMQVFVLGRRVHPYIYTALELALQVGPHVSKQTMGSARPLVAEKRDRGVLSTHCRKFVLRNQHFDIRVWLFLE